MFDDSLGLKHARIVHLPPCTCPPFPDASTVSVSWGDAVMAQGLSSGQVHSTDPEPSLDELIHLL